MLPTSAKPSMEMSSTVLLLFLYLNSGFAQVSGPDGETQSGLYLMQLAVVWYLDSWLSQQPS